MTLTCAHLVGSLPYPDAATTFSEITSRLGGHLKRIPDGETGARARWIFWQRGKIEAHPAMEVDTDDGPAQIHQWDGTLIREWDLFRFKPGIDPETVDFDPGYAPEAVSSYALFRKMRAAGTIAAGVRFQVCLPTPMAVGYWFVAPSARADFFRAYERAFKRDIEKICAAIPKEDLAIQWDVCQEVLAWEGYFPNRPDSYKQDITGMLARLGNAVPEPVELGYHLCYGTPNDEHLVMPADLANAVEMTHGIVDGLDRSLQFIHMPAPKDRDDDAYYAPLKGLRLPRDCELYLGVIHHDDREGDRRRIAAATNAVPMFGIATECGWGRGAPERGPSLLESHRVALEET